MISSLPREGHMLDCKRVHDPLCTTRTVCSINNTKQEKGWIYVNQVTAILSRWDLIKQITEEIHFVHSPDQIRGKYATQQNRSTAVTKTAEPILFSRHKYMYMGKGFLIQADDANS